MLEGMRITLTLPDALAEEAKLRALAEGRTFTSLVAEGLRSVLHQPPVGRVEPLPTFGEPGGTILVNVADKGSLEATLDGDGVR